jgi:superfamily II DNA or RNA helicase
MPETQHTWNRVPNPELTYDPSRAAMRLRPYQVELVNSTVAFLDRAPPGSKGAIVVATGGGKGAIASEVIWHQAQRSRRNLVVTFSWHLIEQLARDLVQRKHGALAHIGLVGGKGKVSDAIPRRYDAAVTFTTIQTYFARAEWFATQRYDMVAIDELHWGEEARRYRKLLTDQPQARFVGFTATPRSGSLFTTIGRAVAFAELVSNGTLARPFVRRATQTGIEWEPTLRPDGDFDAGSLSELGRNRSRNQLVVDVYLRSRGVLGKTLVFACDIEHAKMLADMLVASGVRAAAIHSNLPSHERDSLLRRFGDGELDVLVNVALLTHGVDIPDIKTVMLARPTNSMILFAQMVGRGSRKAPGKDKFNVIDFHDNIRHHGRGLIQAATFFGPEAVREEPRARPIRHVHEIRPFEVIPLIPGFESLAGFEINPGQTFGIEFEIFDPFQQRGQRWQQTAQAILDALRPHVPTAERPIGYHGANKNLGVWNIEPDGSCGFEVTTPILQGREGLMEVVDACEPLQRAARSAGLFVNQKTGTHVHLGWQPRAKELRRLYHLVAFFEPALLSLVAPSRAHNLYAQRLIQSLSTVDDLRTLEQWRRHCRQHPDRFMSVNPNNIFGGYGTLEIRMHSGTLEAPKILRWVSLWMRILAAARSTTRLPSPALSQDLSVTLCDGPRGDVRELCRHIGVGPQLTTALVERRDYVLRNSWMRHPVFGATASQLNLMWTTHRWVTLQQPAAA